MLLFKAFTSNVGFGWFHLILSKYRYFLKTQESLPFLLDIPLFFFLMFLLIIFFLQKPENTTSQPPSNQQVVEVAIPHVGKFMIESKEGGYDDEVPLL